MNETTKKIYEIREEIKKLEWEIFELERKNSDWFIGMYTVGNYDYWDDYYLPLGFITEERAKKWVYDKTEDEDVRDAKYFAVTEEIYYKYREWQYLDDVYFTLKAYSAELNHLEGFYSFKNDVWGAIKNLTKDIGIEEDQLSFKHPGQNKDEIS